MYASPLVQSFGRFHLRHSYRDRFRHNEPSICFAHEDERPLYHTREHVLTATPHYAAARTNQPAPLYTTSTTKAAASTVTELAPDIL